MKMKTLEVDQAVDSGWLPSSLNSPDDQTSRPGILPPLTEEEQLPLRSGGGIQITGCHAGRMLVSRQTAE